MAWSMDKEEYLELKKQNISDKIIAKENFISYRTLDRWKRKEGILSRVTKYDVKDIYALYEGM